MDQRQRHDSHSIEATADAHTIASAASPRAWSVCRHASPKMIMMTKNGRVKEGNMYVFFREKPQKIFINWVSSGQILSCLHSLTFYLLQEEISANDLPSP